MMNTCFRNNWILLVLFHGILFGGLSTGLRLVALPTLANETDLSALLDFKNMITQDPNQVLRSWNGSMHFCDWVGVSCSSSNGRVIHLNLASLGLAGTIPRSIGNLTYLTGLDISNNNIHGEIPQEMGHLFCLEEVNMSYNNLGGNIPTNLTHCSQLRKFDIMVNKLVGRIPDELGTLSKLVVLNLATNNMTGNVPSWIGNFSSLLGLSLIENNFQGSIPAKLGHLPNLGFLQVSKNNLSGIIPSSIYNISSLYYFSVGKNQLHGQLPPDVGLMLPKLRAFGGGLNNFIGPIPESLSNASGLEVLDFTQNGLTGALPRSLGNLKILTRLNFEFNNLGDGKIGDLGFLSDLVNCTSLQVLGLAYNSFGGELPSSIANLSSQLRMLTLGDNRLRGSLPAGIEKLTELTLLGLQGANLSGNLPKFIGELYKLEVLALNHNRFSGLIPSSLGNLTKLSRLFLEENRLEGSIPPSFGNFRRLEIANFSTNNLKGTMPRQVIGLSSLSIALDMSHNYLSGSLPPEVGNLKNLGELDLSYNRLSGQIPSTLSSCVSLERLHLEGNMFNGTLPQSLGNLKSLLDLDLSVNNLSGKIPGFLSNLSTLRKLNLSNNDFEGEVPNEGILANLSIVSLDGNDKLYGGIPELRLPTCTKTRHKMPLSTKVIIVVTISTTSILGGILCSLALLRALKTKRRKSTASCSKECQSNLSYDELMKSTNGFSLENLIGSGSFGSVYKGFILGYRKFVAVKVLNLQQQGALKSFIDECNALRSIRHRNLLKVITCCSSIDHQGHEFKALVFEFMSNGNLDQRLHPTLDARYQAKKLSLIQRLDIAIDIASALDYLHHHCDTPIVHCDLKPSNVLLDEDMTAHVGDFGLAGFLSAAPENENISIGLKGSIGYIPPEYGVGNKISVQGDTYSYGILLLELFTGKRPTDDMFKNNTRIQDFVAMALPDHVMEIADPTMFVGGKNSEEVENKDDSKEKAMYSRYKTQASARRKVEECLILVMRIGLSCSETSPENRIPMDATVNQLSTIRSSLLVFRDSK